MEIYTSSDVGRLFQQSNPKKTIILNRILGSETEPQFYFISSLEEFSQYLSQQHQHPWVRGIETLRIKRGTLVSFDDENLELRFRGEEEEIYKLYRSDDYYNLKERLQMEIISWEAFTKYT